MPPVAAAVPLTGAAITTSGNADSNGLTAEPASNLHQNANMGRNAAMADDGKLAKTNGSNGFDFTALNAIGQPSTPSTGAKAHPCVRDNVTGLTWEVKTNDGGLRDQNWTYTWYNSNAATNGGSVGYSGGTCLTAGRCDTEKYAQDVNATRLCGYSDWRMPTVKELETIVDSSRTNPAIDPTYFPNTVASTFWSGSAYAGSSNAAMGSCFHGGYADNYVKFSTFPVRLVRGGTVIGNR